MSIRAEKKAISVVKKSVLNGIHALDLVFSEGILQLVCRGGVSGRGGGSFLWQNPVLVESLRDGGHSLGVTPCPAAFPLPALPRALGRRPADSRSLP